MSNHRIAEKYEECYLKILLIIIINLAIIGCNPFVKKDNLSFTSNDTLRREAAKNIDFNQISQKILVPHCIRCHSKYNGFNTVFGEKEQILKSVESNRMPKNKPALSLNLKQLLRDWISSGARRNNDSNTLPRESKTPAGLSPKMKELYLLHTKPQPVLDDAKEFNLSKTGKTYNFEFTEGRVAQLQYSISKSLKIISRIDLIENTCQKNFRPKACLYITHARKYKKRVAWIKHKDKKKIGELLQYSYNEEDTEFYTIEDNGYIGANSKLFSPKLDTKTQDYIICDDWKWLGQDRAKLASWSIEQMIENPETQLSENRATGVLYDLELKKYDKYIYRLSNAKFIDSYFSRFPLAYINGETGSFFYQQDNKQCSVGFKFDSSTIGLALLRDDEQRVTYKPYHKGQDSTYLENDTDFFNDSIRTALKGAVK